MATSAAVAATELARRPASMADSSSNCRANRTAVWIGTDRRLIPHGAHPGHDGRQRRSFAAVAREGQEQQVMGVVGRGQIAFFVNRGQAV